MMRILARLALIGVVLAMVGCGRKPDETVTPEAKAAPTVMPKEVVAAMYEAAMAHDDAKVLACFDKATVADAKEFAELLKAAGKRGPRPCDLFYMAGITVGDETIDGDKATVVLVKPDGKPYPLGLSIEDGEWKVAMSDFATHAELLKKKMARE